MIAEPRRREEQCKRNAAGDVAITGRTFAESG
jgi:hypothetical protein